MTWDEFKASVDQQLAEAGKNGSIDIFWIDCHMPNSIAATTQLVNPDQPELGEWLVIS